MLLLRHISAGLGLLFLLSPIALAQQPPREQRGAPPITVSHADGKWTIAGRQNTISLNETDLALRVQASGSVWEMVASSPTDMLVRSQGRETYVRLADAERKTITRFDTGFKTGVKIVLSGWTHDRASGKEKAGGTPAVPVNPRPEIDLTLVLTICLEGKDEELVFDSVANEHEAVVKQLDWPAALATGDVDYTLLSNGRGTLLPRNWPKEYYPIRTITPEGKIAATDHSLLQSHVIESWSMSWWGFQKGKSALMVIIETPDDAAYQFSHPAGGPTVIGPRWRAQLGRFGYLRTARYCFFADGNYVDLAKRYRRSALESGLFVSLKEKIARTPGVSDLLGTPQMRLSILRNLKSDSDRYDPKDPSKNYSLTTFDERARALRELKAKGVDRLLVIVTGWAHFGYDRQHPDPLPPPEKAGGWAEMKRLLDTCRELGYTCTLADQYRDYYLDAPSYDPQFAVREADASLPPQQFPGSRFGDSKQGDIPLMRHWDGGTQGYLNARLMLGHLLKNYQLFSANNIKVQGIYIDVVGYVPPDEDFNTEHPTTHSDAMRGQAALLNWSRQNLGVIATEAGSDWVIPYVDSINQSGGGSKAILVPLYQLVFHDAVVISYGARDEKSLLQGLLYGGAPEMPSSASDEKTISLVRQMAALHKRVGLLEMTKHEFIGENYRKERTTFADGTMVTVDWDANTVTISPALSDKL
jgi:hypothetical protein